MTYFVTGATGFIGRHLQGNICWRARERCIASCARLRKRSSTNCANYFGADGTAPRRGRRRRDQADAWVDAGAAQGAGGKGEAFLPPGRNLRSDRSAEAQQLANVQGTRNAVDFAHEVAVARFHLTSSIAAAGLYEGVFHEDMFEEAENLEHPYFRTKHESEAIVRDRCKCPWRVFRPGIVVGDSRTGEMDKIDGPYYFFKRSRSYGASCRPGCRRSASKAAVSTWCRWTSWSLPSITSRTRGSRRPLLSSDRPERAARGRHPQHLRARWRMLRQ